MTRIFYSSAILFLIPFFAGCQGSANKENVKLSEVINKQQAADNKNLTVSLNIYLFRVKKEYLPELQYRIVQSDSFPVKYEDSDSFTASGLIACQGDRKSWQKLAPFIVESHPITKKRISLLIAENLTNDVVISEEAKPVSIFYRSEDIISGMGFEAGRMILRLKVSPLLGLRQACKLDVKPVYVITGPGKTQSAERNREFSFDSASLSVHLQPGQYVLIAPANDKQKQNETQTIGNIISYQQTKEETADLCLIACSSINSPF